MIIRSGGDARRLIYCGHQCHLAANASRPPSIPPPLLLPMPTTISLLRLRRNSSLKSSTLDPPSLHSPHMRWRRHRQQRGWRGGRAGGAAAERLATLAGDSTGPRPVYRGAAWMVDGVDYLSMLATGNRGSLSGPVDVLLPHIGRIIRLASHLMMHFENWAR